MQRPKLSQDYRLLDIDDLLLIKMIGDGASGVQIARTLLISPAAVCHRVKKYSTVWPGFFVSFKRFGRGERTFCEEFPAIHKKVCAMLEELYEGVDRMYAASDDSPAAG